MKHPILAQTAVLSLLFNLGLVSSMANANETAPLPFQIQYDENCILEAIRDPNDQRSLEALRENCHFNDVSLLEKRLLTEKNQKQTLSNLIYRPNYVLPVSFNAKGTNANPVNEIFGQNQPIEFQDIEMKFQVSLKIPVAENVFGDNGNLYAAYTNRSFWQAYNGKISAPFRETNHEPEAWLRFNNNTKIMGWKNRLIDFGLSHQSNGQAGSLSRSWNRLYARFIFENDTSAFVIKPFFRFKEPASSDDNPDILDYMGNFKFLYTTQIQKHGISLMLRNNLKTDLENNKGALQLDYTYPIHNDLNFYVQWFNGYGESLIDYNYQNNSIGVGIKINNWLSN